MLDHGGRVYLAKDACLSPEHFRAMYPNLDRFREIKARLDPDRPVLLVPGPAAGDRRTPPAVHPSTPMPQEAA